MEGALCKESEGGIGVGNIVGKTGRVFKVGLEAVREEQVSKSGGPKGLSKEAESCFDLNPSEDWLPADDGAGDREGVQGCSTELATALPYFCVMLGTEEESLVKVMMQILSKLR